MNGLAKFPTLIIATIVMASLCGCAAIRNKDDASVASAAPLDSELVAPSKFTGSVVIADKKNYLGAVLLDSIHKCHAFVNKLDLSEGDANFLGDSFSTVFSALATVTKPINTVHGLTAASTIASGTKNAYLSGYFANATIANFGMAMQTTYFVALQDYMDALPGMDDADIVVPIEIGKIETIHAFCSMASAQYIITKTLGSATASQTAANVSVRIDFDPANVAKVGSDDDLTVTLVNGSNKAATLSDDMSVAVTSNIPGFSLVGAPFAKSSCDTQHISIAKDGQSFVFQKSGTVPSGSCTIKLSIKVTSPGSVTAEVTAGALKTDLGSNATGTGPKTLNFTTDGKPPKSAPPPAGVAAAPVPAHGVGSVNAVRSSAPRKTTRSCVPTELGKNPCAN